jgi:hypothetical protein
VVWFCLSRGGGLVVSAKISYFEDTSLISTGCNFLVVLVRYEKTKKMKKRPGVGLPVKKEWLGNYLIGISMIRRK